MNYNEFLSEQSKNRKPSPIRALIPISAREGMISLGAGHPNPETFPYKGLIIKLKDGESIEVDPLRFEQSLSYSQTAGLPQLVEFLHSLQQKVHVPPNEVSVSVGCGSQDLLTKAFEMVIDPGAEILVEDPTYAGIITFLRSQPCNLVEVSTDGQGIIPDALEKTLTNWPADRVRPRVLYTVPVGGNPSGANTALERKKKIYQLCKQHNIIIFEDDPYYYLQFGDERVPSYLSMDDDGRVLRFDSLSKILSSGLRLGWVTGPKPLIDRIDLHTMCTNLQPSGISQLMAYELLRKWGIEGFLEHTRKVASVYREKCSHFIKCLEKHLSNYAEWTVPDAGMFVWVKLLGGVTDSFSLITNRAIAKSVLAVPGVVFIPSEEKTPFVRLSFSLLTTEQMDEALRRFAEAMREEIAAINST